MPFTHRPYSFDAFSAASPGPRSRAPSPPPSTRQRRRSLPLKDAEARHASLGHAAKLLADSCAEDCAHTQHLVCAIAKCARSAEAAEASRVAVAVAARAARSSWP